METYGTTKSGFDTTDTEAQSALIESGIVKPGYTVMGLYDKDVYGEDELRDYLVVTAVLRISTENRQFHFVSERKELTQRATPSIRRIYLLI